MKTTNRLSLICGAALCMAAPHKSYAGIEPIAHAITHWRQTQVPSQQADQRRKKIQEPRSAMPEASVTVQEQNGFSFARIQRGDTTRKEIALTFDDGPHPSFTPKLLDLLKQLNLHATFFLVGEKVDQAPYLLPRMLQEGHDVANHTYHHVNLKKLPIELIDNEMRLASDAIRRADGQEPAFFRPPGGQYNDDVVRNAAKLKMITVLWTDDPGDYASPGAEVIEDRLLKHVRPGAVILLHDGMEQTYRILPDFVAKMRSEGYKFVTLSEMARHLEATHLAHKE